MARWTENWDLSPNAKRAVIEARGEIFTVPAEKGDVRNLTRTPGARERNPVWSPDGKWIAYLSDRSGEFKLHLAGSDGKAPDRQVTRDCDTYRFACRWSPDSKKLAFHDKRLELWWCEIDSGKLHKVDKCEYDEISDYTRSPDSQRGPPSVDVREREQARRRAVASGRRSDERTPARLDTAEEFVQATRACLVPRTHRIEHRPAGHLRASAGLAPRAHSVADDDQRPERSASSQPTILVGLAFGAVTWPDRAGAKVIVMWAFRHEVLAALRS